MWNKLAYAISCRTPVLWNFTIELLQEKYWFFLLNLYSIIVIFQPFYKKKKK